MGASCLILAPMESTLNSRFSYLDLPEIQEQLLDYTDGQIARVQLFIPQIQCAACLHRLEQIPQHHKGIVSARVNFLKRNLAVEYLPGEISLRELVSLLTDIGYEPEISLNQLHTPKSPRPDRSFLVRLGVAGFAFGNIMLLSFPEYLGLDKGGEGGYQTFFLWLMFFLSLPVVFYSGQIFFKSAWQGIKQKSLNIDVPVSLGILALFIRSTYESLYLGNAAYWDSLAGLIFFLLIGKWIQQRTYAHLAFDRDYKAFFPLAATRQNGEKTESVSISSLKSGDQVWVRNKELIPGDGELITESAEVDYSFVTGEAEPVSVKQGDQVYAGGRQIGGAILVEIRKPLSQSYLTQLWNQDAFETNNKHHLSNLTHNLARHFTVIVLALASIAALYWGITTSGAKAADVFTAVLIVACPCGIALTMPVVLGAAMRILGLNGMYVKNYEVVAGLSQADHIVFDKTGTLTDSAQADALRAQVDIDPEYAMLLAGSLTAASTHPVSQGIAKQFCPMTRYEVADFREYAGAGISGQVDGHQVAIGSGTFARQLTKVAELPDEGTCLVVDGELWGNFELSKPFREGWDAVVSQLGVHYPMSLLSGDNEQTASYITSYFPQNSDIRYRQSPMDKLNYIAELQGKGEKVMMIGDGLNDAGALQESHVGIAVMASAHAFTPACDAIWDAKNFRLLPKFLHLAKGSIRNVKIGLIISLLYNVIGLGFAVSGVLTPLVAAILMPLSAISVVLWGWLSVNVLGRQLDLQLSSGNHLS